MASSTSLPAVVPESTTASSYPEPVAVSAEALKAMRSAPDPFVLAKRGGSRQHLVGPQQTREEQGRIGSWYRQTIVRVKERRSRQTASTAPPMPLNFFHRTLKAHRHTRSTYCQLFLFIPFLLAFVFLFYADRDIEGDYYSASAIRTTLIDAALPPVDLSTVTNTTTADNVPADSRNPFSQWSYFDNGQEFPDGYDTVKQLLMPILFPSQQDRQSLLNISLAQNISGSQNASAVPDRIRSIFLGAVQPIGPVRIRAKHVRPNTCDSMDTTLFSGRSDVVEFFRNNCFAGWDADDEEDDWSAFSSTTSPLPWTPFVRREGCDRSVTGTFVSLFGLIKHYNCGGFYVDLPLGSTSLDDARAIADVMNAERFQHGRHARLIQLSLFLYRGAGDVFLHVDLYTEVTIGGGWSVRASVSPFRLAFINGGWMAYAVFVLIFFVMFTIAYVTRGAVHYATRGTFLWSFFLQPWNIVELVNMIAFYLWFGFYCAWWSRSQDVSDRMDTTGGRDRQEGDYPLQLVEIHALYWITSYLNALNVLFLFLKLLKFLRLNARINVLERTLIAAARSLASVVAVLCLFVLAYSICGMILYGGFLFEYRNLADAWATTFRVLIGTFDYASLNQIYRAATFVYFWTFMVFGAFALLNFCIAILMKHFEEQYNQAQLPPVLLSIRLSFESFIFYTGRTSGWTIAKDFVTYRSREWSRGAALLADRCATRKLLHRIRQRDMEQELLQSMGPAAVMQLRNTRRTSIDPPADATSGAIATETLEKSVVREVKLEDTSSSLLDVSMFQASTTTASSTAGAAAEEPTVFEATTVSSSGFRRSFAGTATTTATGGVDDNDCTDDVASPTAPGDGDVVLGGSARRRQRRGTSTVEIVTPRPPAATTRSPSPPPHGPTSRPIVTHRSTAHQPQPQPQPQQQQHQRRKHSSTVQYIQAKWNHTTGKSAVKVRDQDLIRSDLSALYHQAAASEDSLFVSYYDMFNEQRSAKRRSADARQELAELEAHREDVLQHTRDVKYRHQQRIVAVTTSSPHDEDNTLVEAEEEEEERNALSALAVVDDDLASLRHELRLLDVMMSVPTSDLESIWCRLYDEFEGTSTAQSIRASQGRTRAVQESVTKAVSAALMPLRRRLFDASVEVSAGTPSPSSAASEAPSASAAVAKAPRRTTSTASFIGTPPSTMLDDAPLMETTSFASARQESSVAFTLDSTDEPSPTITATAKATAATAAARRRRAGSVIAAHVLPSTGDFPGATPPPAAAAARASTATAKEGVVPVPSYLVVTNGDPANTFQHALADMESFLGAATTLLEGALGPLRAAPAAPLHLPPTSPPA